MTLTLSAKQARRLALTRAGLLEPATEGLPRRASGRGQRARRGALAVLGRFGYLQLDTVSVAGARSHAIVLASRLHGFDARLGEELLQPGEPVFEYWGHEACWLPMELYPAFEFRRQQYRHHPWWGDLIGENPRLAESIVERIRNEGPLRSLDLEGKGSGPWWGLKLSKKVVSALWFAGDLAVSERRNFQRRFDLTERVIPSDMRRDPLSRDTSMRLLILKALDGHGWASRSTIAATWRLRGLSEALTQGLRDLEDEGVIARCSVVLGDGRRRPGFIKVDHLTLLPRLNTVRPRRDRGVLLSPFDPVLWDRRRVDELFGFEQLLEIFKPAAQRRFGYYCLPVLAGETLIARVDLKAHRRRGELEILSLRYEGSRSNKAPTARDAEAVAVALARYATTVGLASSYPSREASAS